MSDQNCGLWVFFYALPFLKRGVLTNISEKKIYEN